MAKYLNHLPKNEAATTSKPQTRYTQHLKTEGANETPTNISNYYSRQDMMANAGLDAGGSAQAASTKIVDEVSAEVQAAAPAELTRWQKWSNFWNSGGQKVAQGFIDTSRVIRNDIAPSLKGGVEALVGDELTAGQKAKAAGMGLVDMMVGIGNSVIDFGTITIPKTIAVGGKMIGDTMERNAAAPLPEKPEYLLNPKNAQQKAESDRWDRLQERRVQMKADQKRQGSALTDWAEDVITGLDIATKERRQELGIEGADFFSPKNFGYNVGSGATSLAVAAGVTYVTKSPTAAGLILGAVEASDTYVEATDKLMEQGMSEAEAESMAAKLTLVEAGGIAYLEKLGLEALFRNYVGGRLRNAAIGAITETVQENTQTVWSNAVAKYGYDETQSLTEGIVETTLLTLPVGFIGGGVLQGHSDQVDKTVKMIESSEAVNIEKTIAAGDMAASDVYVNGDTEAKVMTPMYREGRVNDIALKLDTLQNGLGDYYKTQVGESVTLEQAIKKGIEVAKTGGVANIDPTQITTPAEERKQVVDKVAAANPDVDPKDIEELYNATREAIDTVAYELPDAQLRADEATNDLYADIAENVEQKGTDKVVEALLNDESLGLDNAEEANQLIDQAVAEYNSQSQQQDPFAVTGDTLDDDIAAAIAAVTGEVQSVKKDTTSILDQLENLTPEQEQAANDLWETEYQPQYEKLQNQINKMEKKAKEAKGNEKNNLQAEIAKAGAKQGEIENDFIAKARKTLARDQQERAKNIVNEVSTEVAANQAIEPAEFGEKRTLAGMRNVNPTLYKLATEATTEADFLESVAKSKSQSVKGIAEEDLKSWFNSVDKLTKEEDNKQYGDTNDTRGSVQPGTDTESGSSSQGGQSEPRSKGATDSESVARGERGERSTSAGERSGTRVEPKKAKQIVTRKAFIGYDENGVYTYNTTRKINEKQKGSALNKAVVQLFKNAGESLENESTYFEVKREGYMPLHIERLPNHQLAISHVFTQNGDLMRDPEVVFDILEDGQLEAKTIEHPPMVLGGRELVGPVPIKKTDSFLKMWADNLKAQGFLTEATVAENATTDRSRIAELENDMRAIYLAKGESDMEGYSLAEQKLSEILVSLEIAEAGFKFPVGDTGEWTGVPSTFPQWIPENARNRSDLDYALQTFDDVRTFSFPSKKNETKRRGLANALFEELDAALNVSTEVIREEIMSIYDQDKITEPEKGKTTYEDDTSRGKKTTEAQNLYHATSLKNLESIIKNGLKPNDEGNLYFSQTTEGWYEQGDDVLLKVDRKILTNIKSEPSDFTLEDSILTTDTVLPQNIEYSTNGGRTWKAATEEQSIEEKTMDSLAKGEAVKATDVAKAMGIEVVEVKLDERSVVNHNIESVVASYDTAEEFARAVIYHGTKPDYTGRILRNGFKVGAGTPGVSFSWDFETALSYTDEIDGQYQPMDVVAAVPVKGAENIGTDGVDKLTGEDIYAPGDVAIIGRGEMSKGHLIKLWKANSGKKDAGPDLNITEGDIKDAEIVAAGGREKMGAEGRGLLDQYWTPPEAVKMTYDVLRKLGVNLDGATVLEPSIGAGNFLSGLPKSAAVTGFEIDENVAKALKIKRPDVAVVNMPFERVFVDESGNKQKFNAVFDLVIGNPPYGKHRGKYKGLGEEEKIAKYENYFIKRSLDVTKSGGYVALVVPSAFLRNSSKEAGKSQIAQLGRLEAAFRLPNGAFDTTDIGTDILVFRKDAITDMKSQAGQINHASRLATMSDDKYFRANTNQVLGYETTRTGRFGVEPVVEGSLAAAKELFDATDYAGVPDGNPIIKETYVDLETGAEIEKKAANPEVKERAISTVQSLSDANLLEEVQKTDDLDPVQEQTRRVAEQAKELKQDSKEPRKTKSWRKPKEGVLDLRTFTEKEAYDDGQWEYVQPTGELAGEFDQDKAFYMDGKYYNEFNYVQGNIYQKLEQLEADKDIVGPEKYQKQKEMLEAVIPERMTVDRMRVAPHTRFAETTKLPHPSGAPASLQTLFLEWIKKLPYNAFGDSSAYDVRRYTLGQPVRGGDKLENEKNRRTRRIVGDEMFSRFLKDELSEDQKAVVEAKYNQQFNGYHKPDYGNVPLRAKVNANFKGSPLTIRPVQHQGVGFLLNRGVGLLAHDVGVGKTMQGIIANLEMLERGWAKRPLIVLPNINVYKQWIKEIKELDSNIEINELANLGGDFKGDAENLKIKAGSLSLITEEGFKRLQFSEETYNRATEQFNDVILNPDEKKTKRGQALDEEKAAETVGKMQRKTKAEFNFEDLGFDALTIDEIHNANHIIGKAKPKDGEEKTTEFRGFQLTPSQYGLKTWLASQYIQEKNNGRNVIGLSATPFTNHPLEYYSILSLFARQTMQDMGILNVNDFMSMFMDVTSMLEFKANGDYSEKTEVRNFKNYQQFQQLLTQFIDFRELTNEELQRPARNTREYRVPENQAQFDYKQMAQPLFNDKTGSGFLQGIGELRQIAFSPFLSRFNQAGIPDAKQFVEGSPKIKLTMDLVAETLKNVKGAGQLIYSTLGVETFPLMQQYLIEEVGLKPSEVAIISGKTPKNKRSQIQQDFNDGKVKVILGSDAIQEGVNLQEKTTDLYLLSQPWNFTAVRQVIGRAWRQGNQWRNVRINQMFTENSIDIFMSQKLQNKEKRYEESLKNGDDVVDVGDIDYEELKHSLLTDPVARTELEYNEKDKELSLEISRLESEAAYANRKNEQYVKAWGDVQKAKEKKAEHPDWEWLDSQITNAEKRLADLSADLKDRGVDVAAVEKNMNETESKIEELRAKQENLKAEREAAIKAAEAERENQLDTVSTVDSKKHITDRRADDEDLFLGDDPRFKAVPIRDEETGEFRGSRTVERAEVDELANEIASFSMKKGGYMVDYDVEIAKNMARGGRTEEAYAYKRTFRAINREQMIEKLKDYNDRFNLGLSVEFADVLFMGDPKIVGSRLERAQAYAVADKWGIAFSPYVGETTVDHEMVHRVMKDLVGKEGNPFSEFKKGKLYGEAFRELKKDSDAQLSLLNKRYAIPDTLPKYPGKAAPLEDRKQFWQDVVVIEEYMAEQYELYQAKRQIQAESMLGRFYQAIQDAMAAFAKAFGRDLPRLAAFYRTLSTGRDSAKGPRKTLKVNDAPGRRGRARFQTTGGVKYLDFGMLKAKKDAEDLAGRAKLFNTLLEDAENDPSVKNSIKKDINLFENLLAQSRDIYLKDETEFAAADLYEQVAELQDADKERLDKMLADMIDPYMKLKQSDRERVDKILWEGDAVGKEFADFEILGRLTDTQFEAYKGVRKALNLAHEMLLQEMRNKGISEEEIEAFRREREGYMPHKWKYPYVVKHQRTTPEGGRHQTHMMESFKTERQAKARAAELSKMNDDPLNQFEIDKLSSLEVDFFASQELTMERMVPVIENMKVNGYIKDEVSDMLKNNLMDMFKEKGFGRHYLRRTGVGGFDTTRNPEVLANYFTGFSGYISKMRHSSAYFNALSKVDARRQPQFYSWLRDTIAYKLNNKPEDIRIPIGIGEKKLEISVRGLTFGYFLANDISYLLTNATQNFIVGLGEMSKYMQGTQKIIGPEKRLLSAMFDYSAGRISAEERKVIDDILARGQLGAEMSSDLTGFKNNPVYSEISSRFHKVMFKSTAIIEQNVNRIPAFLAMYRLFMEQGMNSEQAAVKALEVSNDIHFRYGRQHRPKAFRGKLAVVFVFQHYIRSLLFQLYRDTSRGEWAALTRKLGYTGLLGGTLALPFVKLIIEVIRGIGGDDREEEEIIRELDTWEIALTRGLPAAFLGVDLSSRVGIGLMSVDSIWENPSDVRSYIGATGSLLFKRLPQGVEMIGQDRYADAAGKLLPDVAANPIKALTGYFWGVRSSSGNPLLDENNQPYKYNTWEALIRAAGYTPTHEAILWDQNAQNWKAEDYRSAARTDVRRTIQGMVQRGEIDAARDLQESALEEGLISENTDYVKEFNEANLFNEAVEKWEASNKAPATLQDIEDELIDGLYNGKVTDLQRNNVRKELAVYRQYGLENPYVDDIMKLRSNADKVQYLIELKEEIGEEAFAEFYATGRRKIKTEAGNLVPILFSDNLTEELRKAQKANEAATTEN